MRVRKKGRTRKRNRQRGERVEGVIERGKNILIGTNLKINRKTFEEES